MKAAWYSHNGEAVDVLNVGERPTPTPAAGEVRVKLATSGVNPSDVKSRKTRPVTDAEIIPHSDGAGVIDAVGEGVPAARIGERVWIWNGQWQRPWGTACEYIALPSAQAVHLPDHIDFAAAACFGIPALTAVQAIHLAGPLQGKNVLVIAASSAVGHYAAQLAVLQGARVIGTVGSTAKAAHVRAVGVQDVIHYKTESVSERVQQLTQGQGVDVIIDMDFSTTHRFTADGTLQRHGTLVCYGSNVPGEVGVAFRPLLWNSVTMKFFLVYDLTEADRAHGLQVLNDLLERNALVHAVAAHYPLQDIALAHQAVEGGQVMGNVVITL
jgi:NADPH2:quinone reductase